MHKVYEPEIRARPGNAAHSCEVVVLKHAQCRPASEREGNNLNRFKDLRTENGSSQSHNLTLTVVFVVRWFDHGADVCGGSS